MEKREGPFITRVTALGACAMICASLLGLCACSQGGGTTAATTEAATTEAAAEEPAQSEPVYVLTGYSYDIVGADVSLAHAHTLDEAGNIVLWAYDMTGSEGDSTHYETSYTYDEHGMPTLLITDDGVTIDCDVSYDDEGRPATLFYVDDSDPEYTSSDSWELTYGADGEITQVVVDSNYSGSDGESSYLSAYSYLYEFNDHGWLSKVSVNGDYTSYSDGDEEQPTDYGYEYAYTYEGEDLEHPESVTCTFTDLTDESSEPSSYTSALTYDEAGNLVKVEGIDAEAGYEMSYQLVEEPSEVAALSASIKAPGPCALFLNIGY